MQLTRLVERLDAHPGCTVVEYLGAESRSRTFPELRDDVAAAAARLRMAGVSPGMRVGILAGNCYQWIVHELAVIELRGVVVALADAVMSGGIETVAERLRLHLIVTDRDCPGRPSWLVPMHEANPPASVRTAVEYTADSEYRMPALVFSSGSFGHHKTIMTSRGGVEQLVGNLPLAFELQDGDRFLVFLPMDSFQQRFLIYGCLWNGVNLVISEPRFLFEALKRHPPTILLAPPAFFEAIAARVRNVPRRTETLLKALHACRERIPLQSLRAALARLTSRRLRDALGGQVRLMITGMAPSRRNTLELFDRIGLPVYEVYGMTECGMIAWNTPRARRLGSVGKPLADAKVTIAADGEVLVTRAVQPTLGYLGEDTSEDQRQTYRGGGTIGTGDIGRFDADGFLYLEGRKKNIIVTAGGVKLHPEAIEQRLNASDDIGQSVVFGTGGALTAVVVARSDTPDVRERIRGFVEAINRDIDSEASIAHIVFCEPLTSENGMLTANLKLNRKAIEARFESADVAEDAA
jgi:long-subunit acyl-CoA synthetase (AMP-forming)